MEDMIDGQTFARVCTSCGVSFIALHKGMHLCPKHDEEAHSFALAPQEKGGAPILNSVAPQENGELAPQEKTPPEKARVARRGEELTVVAPVRIAEALQGYRIMDSRMLNNSELWLQLEGAELPKMYLHVDIGTDGSVLAMYPPDEDQAG